MMPICNFAMRMNLPASPKCSQPCGFQAIANRINGENVAGVRPGRCQAIEKWFAFASTGAKRLRQCCQAIGDVLGTNFKMTVIGDETSSMIVFIRNLWTSGETSYCWLVGVG